MKDSDKRIKFISEYISAYEAQIELLNRHGLFDSAKLFELFAIEVGTLYLGQPLYNLNVGTFNYPFVDLRSEDKSFYVQVTEFGRRKIISERKTGLYLNIVKI